MSMTLGFEDALAVKIELSGGKGANLALLTQLGFPVPPGFIISPAAYWGFISGASGLEGRVAALPFDDPGRMKTACSELRAGLAKLPLPAGLDAEVRERLKGSPPDAAFSVRSSSTMEDLSSAAFAGQHDTYLNCTGADEILRRIKDCVLSLWADRAVAYRRRQGFDHLQASMAVVVQ
jgi:pyruvate,water dikinase